MYSFNIVLVFVKRIFKNVSKNINLFSFQGYFILISEGFYMAANSEPAISHPQLDISNF